MTNNMTSAIFILLFSTMSFAQSGSPSNSLADLDHSLTIHKLSVLPVSDNEGDLYARPVENTLKDSIRKNHHFEFVDAKNTDPRTTLDTYESRPDLVKNLGTTLKTDALIGAKIEKSDKTVNITLDLFLVSDGLLLAQEHWVDGGSFSLERIEKKTIDLFVKLNSKIPYKGLILSRQGNRITLNLGSRDGIKPGTDLSIEQIISIKRHPKFKFLLSSEKEIVGRNFKARNVRKEIKGALRQQA